MVTVTMSRTELSAADQSTGEGETCVRDDRSIATLDGVILPWMQVNTPRVALIGSIETGLTQDTSEWCSHYGWTRSASWADMQAFQAQYGMRFVSHSATYPLSWSNLTSQQQYDETCGSRDAIAAHGLLGAAGQFDWPSSITDSNVQATYVQPCFYFNRIFGSGINTLAWAEANHQEVSTRGINGGSCNVAGRACSTADGFHTYMRPSGVIAAIQNLQPGQHLSLQSYLLVTGRNPEYSRDSQYKVNTTRWNCSSGNPAYHWSNDIERYCWKDFKQILLYLQNDPNVVVTDPEGVALAWGMSPPTM
jgi:hypothetical protein